MKVFVRNAWPGKKKVKMEYKSNIPPMDRKYWLGMALTGLWALILILMLVEGSYTPSMTQYWRNQAHLEEGKKTNGVGPKETQSIGSAKTNGLKIPYPKVGDYFQLGFDVLGGFPSEKPPIVDLGAGPGPRIKKPSAKVPAIIQALDGRKISVAGFMVPMTVERNSARTFILAQSRTTCCYGVIPKLNQWIYVVMDPGKSAETTMDVPVTVFGTLRVGTEFDGQASGWCLYRMTSEKVEAPKRSWF